MIESDKYITVIYDTWMILNAPATEANPNLLCLERVFNPDARNLCESIVMPST